jgi:GTPase
LKALPIISIVGRQNVGKSTLFNCFVKKKIAITHDYPGVTRDVLKTIVENSEFIKPFSLCDTPGLDIQNINDLAASVIEISFEQLLKSDLILYVLDRNEITVYDEKLITLFREDKRFNNKHILYVLNKSDNPENDMELDFFYKLGIKELIPISATGRRNLKILFERINFYLEKARTGILENTDFSISIVGKPNSGKSSILNSILGFNRSVVSEIAGTTRDSVHTVYKYKEKNIMILDTAGIRKQSKKAEELEFYSYIRTLESIKDSDVVIHVIDASKGFGEYDKKIYAYLKKEGKSSIIAVNKWDLIPEKDGKTFDDFKKDLISRFNPISKTPLVSTSALRGIRTNKLIDLCMDVHGKSTMIIPTSELNQKLKTWMSEKKIGSMGKIPKILYGLQTSSSPFKILLFVNHTEHFPSPVMAYLKKKITDAFNIEGIPVEIELRSERRKKAK